ncbi:polygalacturonase-like [Silene latifolia]|uniref:polygalacturonase-like n=1 Tax=Silene latifolia TaxID=37657 RepID=UPI003D770A34
MITSLVLLSRGGTRILTLSICLLERLVSCSMMSKDILGIPVSGDRVLVAGSGEDDDSGLRGKIARFYGVPESDVVPPLYKNGGLLTSELSRVFHIAITGCQNVHIEGVDIIASADSPNTDGIHVQSSTQVAILDSTMRTGDDCISTGPGVKNVHIEGVLCGPGHGISIGSLGWEKKEAGVQNVTVKSVIISNTTNWLRIKSWARPSTGFVQTILYQNVTFRNVENPIIVDQYYCPNNQCPRQESGVKVTDVTYKKIHGTSSTEIAMTFNCSTLSPCSGIKLENVNITFLDQEALSTCSNVKGQALGMVQPKELFLIVKALTI